jgi:hypothetical protein
MLRISNQSQNDFLREWVPKREAFLQLLLDLEGPTSDGSCSQCKERVGQFRCLDCIGNLVHCHRCFMDGHKLLPFHRIKKWNGTHFSPTTLQDQGYIFYLGHHGDVCPQSPEDEWLNIQESTLAMDDVDFIEDGPSGKTKKDVTISMVHTTGVFKHKVRWCQCPNASEKIIQLFQMGLFPASHIRPETAFTFDVLDHFHIDAMECKTAASSFMKKLRRLTNNAFPHAVPVRVNHAINI